MNIISLFGVVRVGVRGPGFVIVYVVGDIVSWLLRYIAVQRSNSAINVYRGARSLLDTTLFNGINTKASWGGLIFTATTISGFVTGRGRPLTFAY